jgi:hypothetical protein
VQVVVGVLIFGGLTVIEIFIPDKVLNMVFFIMIPLLLIGVVMVVHGNIVRNRWGINSHRVRCPRCNSEMPKIRRPKSVRELLWGGGTCQRCGCVMDKWGNQIPT